MAVVHKDDAYGYVNTKGELVIGAQFEQAGSFSEGLAAVLSGDAWGFIDFAGKFAIEPQFEDVVE